jgi:N-acetylglutamate synthase-like GNAT family acetyltransferase
MWNLALYLLLNHPTTMTTLTQPSVDLRIEPATLDDLPHMVELLTSLFQDEGSELKADQRKQEHGLRLILEQPSRGRIFVLRTNHQIIGMINLLFTISTAEGGLVVLLEDMIIHPQHRGVGYGSRLLEHAVAFAKKKDFRRITLLTDRPSNESRKFFESHGFETSEMVPMRLYLPKSER